MSTQDTSLTAAPAKKRIEALDALRGVAVIGIIPMNVIAWSMVPAAYINPRAGGGDGPLETVLWAITFVLVEDKFRTLFAMMFGAGVAILLDKATAHPRRDHYARMAVLLLIGLLHAILLAGNDILRSYALTGCLLPFVLGWPVRRLLVAAGVIVTVQTLVAGAFAIFYLVDPDTASVASAEQTYGFNPETTADFLQRSEEGFGERIARRLGELETMLFAAVVQVPTNLAAMLVGLGLWRSGMLAGQWETSRALGLAKRLALVSVPPLVALAAWAIASGFDAIVMASLFFAFTGPFDLLLGVAYAAAAMALFGGRWSGARLTTRLAATGRMALTNYLATSVVFAALFHACGLGLYGEIGRGMAEALVLLPVTLMLIWSPLWLARFRQGPAEWLWRSLAGLRLLPLRR
ncbi:DUF418 domain-containing protein [Aurantiacibacter sp. MUD61]|uniref:DUF418 domain-containing protein n=1 Tax=Aurantiacibacter sp. MUD61 TaxID=3009083 RepID=UPI0022EFFEFE|nr:DUF418 domain-containing protein [Aurantiacibacter sp. MUD61]